MTRVLALMTGGLAGVFIHCSLVVPTDLGTIHCSDDENGDAGPPACPNGFRCRAGTCEKMGETSLGRGCTSDIDCDGADVCLSGAALGPERANSCSRPCCSSADCGAPDGGFVCLPPPEGGSGYCVANSENLVLGTGLSADPCTNSANCRSGRCEGGVCVDLCCSDLDCGDPQACVLGVGDSQVASHWTCAAPTAGATYLSTCVQDADCASGFCVALQGTTFTVCSKPCCSSGECGNAPGANERVACVPAKHGATALAACALVVAGTGMRDDGRVCTTHQDCRSGSCVDGVCTDLCCGASDCGEGRNCGLRDGFTVRSCIPSDD